MGYDEDAATCVCVCVSWVACTYGRCWLTSNLCAARTQTLSTFLAAVLAKKYTNPSSDIITVLAGLDHIDAVFTDFVGSLDYIIRNGKSSECCSRLF